MNGLRNTNLHDKENIDKSAEKVGSNIELKKYNKPTVEGYDGENEDKIITYFQSNGTFKTDLGSQTLADAAIAAAAAAAQNAAAAAEKESQEAKILHFLFVQKTTKHKTRPDKVTAKIKSAAKALKGKVMKRGKGNVQVTFEEEGQAYALFKTIDTHLKSVGFEVNV